VTSALSFIHESAKDNEDSWVLTADEDPRFAHLLPSGRGTILETIDALSSAPVASLLAKKIALAEAIVRIKQELRRIQALPLEIALREYLGALSNTSGQRLESLAARFGLGGRPPVSLQKAARMSGITREGLRQIQAKVKRRLPAHSVVMPALDRALESLRAAAPLSPDAASSLLLERGLTHTRFHPSSVLEAAKFCARNPGFRMERISENDCVVTISLPSDVTLIAEIAYELARNSGISSVAEVTGGCIERGMGVDADRVRLILRLFDSLQFLIDDWFWDTGSVRNRLRQLSKKMLSLSSPMSVPILRDGIQREYAFRGRDRRRLTVPPCHALDAFYRAQSDFIVDRQGWVSSRDALDYKEELSGVEQTMVLALRSSPSGILDSATFANVCEERGINERTFDVYCSYSPIVERVGTGFLTLRGTPIDRAAVTSMAPAPAKPQRRRVIDHGRSDGGALWLKVRVPKRLGGFVFWVPSEIREPLARHSFAAYSDGSPCGVLRVGEVGNCWGAGAFLCRRGADEGDILVAEFDVSKGVASLRLGNHEVSEDNA
jgi:hypothetical protein